MDFYSTDDTDTAPDTAVDTQQSQFALSELANLAGRLEGLIAALNLVDPQPVRREIRQEIEIEIDRLFMAVEKVRDELTNEDLMPFEMTDQAPDEPYEGMGEAPDQDDDDFVPELEMEDLVATMERPDPSFCTARPKPTGEAAAAPEMDHPYMSQG
jgi:hypothetical protein